MASPASQTYGQGRGPYGYSPPSDTPSPRAALAKVPDEVTGDELDTARVVNTTEPVALQKPQAAIAGLSTDVHVHPGLVPILQVLHVPEKGVVLCVPGDAVGVGPARRLLCVAELPPRAGAREAAIGTGLNAVEASSQDDVRIRIHDHCPNLRPSTVSPTGDGLSDLDEVVLPGWATHFEPHRHDATPKPKVKLAMMNPTKM